MLAERIWWKYGPFIDTRYIMIYNLSHTEIREEML